jgi:membrane protease YdiL (CAAX protease family)
MEDSSAVLSLPASTAPAAPAIARPLVIPRWAAILQVLLVSGIPTQVFLGVALFVYGVEPFQGSRLSLEFFATLSLLDTALVALLLRAFLALGGETSRDVFLGTRPVRNEIVRGLLLLPVVFVAVVGVIYGIELIAPSLNNVAESPIEAFMRTPLDAAIFMVVVVLAGGIREELQRAFILHRFEQRLGGIKVGLVVFGLLFGLLHLDQGFDVAIAIGMLGFFWGILYIRRRSAVAAMVNHASFNAAQVAQHVLLRTFGV